METRNYMKKETKQLQDLDLPKDQPQISKLLNLEIKDHHKKIKMKISKGRQNETTTTHVTLRREGKNIANKHKRVDRDQDPVSEG